MATLGPFKLGSLALVATLLLTVNSVQSEEKCRTGCHGSKQNTFKYEVGTTYKYNLDGNVEVLLSTAEGQVSSTKLKATVLLTQLGECNQILTLQNVQVIGADNKKHNNIPNIDKPIRLNFHDGHIEDLVCATPGDTQVSLNIKRAVASMFQANLKKQYETDVFGVCQTDINTRKEGGVFVIQKSKDLNKCSHRETAKQDFLATSFNLHSEIKTSPILNSEYFSEQRIKNGILDQATINENYLYVPFSVGKNGAKAKVTTKLQYAGNSKEAHADTTKEAKSLLFDSPHPVVSEKSNVNIILNAVKDTVKSIGQTVSDNSANKFGNLVRIIRASKKVDLLNIYNQVRAGTAGDKEVAKKVYLDALFRAGTGDSVEVTIELLKNKQLSPLEQKLVYLGLAFVRHATPASLNAAATLLDQDHLPREAYLGVGTLASRYCKSHSCANEETLSAITQKLLAKLGTGKATNRAKENELIAVLKALGNMNHLSSTTVPKIVAIAQDKKSSNRLRVAALETLRTDACQDKVRDSALNILKDQQQDSEIRIKAYLTATECPNGKVAAAIKTLIQNEPSYQVGGFIVSHLRNLKASANPDKEFAKQQLGLISTNKNYPFDFRKFSYNYEFSYAIDSLGLSTSTESNVIYSQSAFLPRSTSWNMTTQVFGHTVNFLEIDTRQENFDKVLEHYLGPLGVLRSQTPEEALATGKKSADKLIQDIKERVQKSRGKRDISKAEIDATNKQVQIKTNEFNTDLDLDLSVKIFGSELLFLSINDDVRKYSPEVVIDKIFDSLDQGVEKAKNFEHALRSNMIFMDAELSYPTSVGFPLKISVEGVSTFQLQSKGAIDFKAIGTPTNSVFKLSLIPSANVEVTGRLTVDAYFIESGLKTSSNLHTATGAALDFEVFDSGNGADMKLSFPVEKQEIILATHEIVLNNRELGVQEVNVPLKLNTGKEFGICVDQLKSVIGLGLCLDYVRPNTANVQGVLLPYPLDGNSKLSVKIEREDLAYIHVRNVVHKSKKVGLEYLIEAVGENKQKKAGIDVQMYLRPEAYVKLSLDSPIRKTDLEGRITDTQTEKSLGVKLADSSGTYSGKVGVSVSGSGAKRVYTPILNYELPNVVAGQVKVEGQIIAEDSSGTSKYTFNNVKLTAHNQKTYSVNGNLGLTRPSTFFGDLAFSDGKDSASVKGRLQLDPRDFKVNTELKNSVNPQANVNVKYELKRGDGNVDSNLQIIHGADLNSKVNILKLKNSFSKTKVGENDYKIVTKNDFSYPLALVDAKFNFEAEPSKVSYDFDVNYNNAKFGSELDVKINGKTRGDYELDFELEGLKKKVELKLKRVISGEASKIANALVVNGKRYEINGDIKHHYKEKDIDVGADLAIKIAGKSDTYKLGYGLTSNPNDFDAHLKIEAGSSAVVDIFLKSNKGGNANGNVKINLKDILNANGQLKATKGKGNAHIVFDFVKLGSKVKAESSFTIAAPTFDIDLTLYPQFEKDNSKKIVLSSHNKATEKSIDSKNNFNVLDKQLEVNFKASKDGEIMNGKQQGEFEITLPNDLYFSSKFDRAVTTKDDVVNGKGFAVFEQRNNKNTPGRKLTLNAEVKNTNLKQKIIDITYALALDNGNGKTINGDLALKRSKQNEKATIAYKGKLSGSVFPKPWEFDLQSAYEKKAGEYKLKANCEKSSLKLNGEYDLNGGAAPYKHLVDFELHTPSTKFSVVKLKSSHSILVPENIKEVDGVAKGSIAFFVDDDGTAPDATVDVKAEYDVVAKLHSAQGTTTLNFQKLDPITVAVSYGHQDKKCHGDLSIKYAKDKTIKADATLIRPNKNEFDLKLALDTPHDQAKSTKLAIASKLSEDNKHVTGTAVLSHNNQEYKLTVDSVLSKITPSLDLHLKHPDGQQGRIMAKVTKSTPKEFGSEVELTLPKKNFDFKGKLDSKFENIDEFTVKVTADSASMKLDKIVAEATNKGGKGGKKIQFTVTQAGKNYISGSTTYKASEERGKFILEGSGTVKVKDESKSANFKFTRENLETEKNGEQGINLSFDARLGNKAVDAEFKATNKQIRVLNSYCEETKQCAHFEVDSKLSDVKQDEINHVLEINIDLRKLGLSHEFGLKAVTNAHHFVIDHTVDVHFQNQENSKYQYSVYLHPKEAGVSLTTPKRVVSLEGKLDIADNKHVKAQLFVYLDKKNQPNKKAALTYDLTVQSDKKALTSQLKSETKLSAPGLPKDLVITYSQNSDMSKHLVDFDMVIDIFANPNQKIVLTGKSKFTKDEQSGYGGEATITAKSAGLHLDFTDHEEFYVVPAKKEVKYQRLIECSCTGKKYATGLNFDANPSQLNYWVKVLNRDLVNIKSKFQFTKESQKIDSNIDVFGTKPIVTHAELLNYNTYHYTLAYKDTPNNKLKIDAAFIFGQIADYRAEIVKDGKKIDLIHASVKLDDANFLKSDYGVKYDNIKQHVFAPVKERVGSVVAKRKELAEEISREATEFAKGFSEKMKNSPPNLKNTRDYYGSELNKIKNELAADKTIQKLAEFLKPVFGTIAQSCNEIFLKVSEFAEKVCQTIQANFSKVMESIQTELIPLLKTNFEKLVTISGDVAEQVTDILFLYLGKIYEFLEKHQKELKQISAYLSQISQDIARAVSKITENLRELITTQLRSLYEEIKALPIYEELKSRYHEQLQNLHISDAMINTFKETAGTVKDIFPLPEWKKLVGDITVYVEKLLRNEKVDDSQAITLIVHDFVNLIKSLFESINIKNGEFQTKVQPVSFDYFFRLPKHVAIKLSPISFLLNGELPSLREFLHTVSFNPRLWIPPFQIQGIIAQGQHIFTFDGKHLTFPGKCNYLLVKDAVNGNFSVFGTYTNGLLTAVTVSDKQNTATIKKDGKFLFNNAASEYPVRQGLIDVFRQYDSIHIVSKAGLQVICTEHLEGCVFLVSGFYHGQLRGLLGNGNNEAYDDFTLPNGKIVTSESDFGNAYKTSNTCPAVKTVDHSHHSHAPACNKYFGDESSLRYCYAFVDPENYRTACDHGIAAGVANTEHATVSSYVVACNLRGIRIRLPEEFLKCKNGDGKRDLGDTFSVKTPTKAVDIVIAIDQAKTNEPVYKELVQPLVQQLNTEFAGKGLSDIEYHVIGYGGEYQKYPSHFTVGGKLSTKAKLPEIKFTEKPKEKEISVDCPKLEKFLRVVSSVIKDAELALGFDLQSRAYKEATSYPFRSHASKVVIAVSGEPCKHGRFLLLQYIRALINLDESIHLNLITPFETLSKDDKPVKNVIGFNEDGAFTLDSKKKEPNAELIKELQYNDYCVDFTIGTNGNAFVTNNFLQAKGAQKQHYIQTVGHSIVDQVTSKVYGLDCECKKVTPLTARNVCKMIDVKDKSKKGSGKS